jgi:hypothetical protein
VLCPVFLIFGTSIRRGDTTRPISVPERAIRGGAPR